MPTTVTYPGIGSYAALTAAAGALVMDANCSGMDGDAPVRLASTQLYVGGDARLSLTVIG